MRPRLYSILLQFSFLALISCHASKVKSGDDSYARGLAATKDLVSKYGEVPRTSYLISIESKLEDALKELSGKIALSPRVIILRSKERFAYSPGGGFVLLSSGLVNKLNVEAEFVFVIAHELAHQELGHNNAHHDFKREPYMRDLELKADLRGVGIISRAGFDPRAAITALFLAYGGSGSNLSSETHPSLSERVLAIEELIKKAKWAPPGVIDSRDYRKFKDFLSKSG